MNDGNATEIIAAAQRVVDICREDAVEIDKTLTNVVEALRALQAKLSGITTQDDRANRFIGEMAIVTREAIKRATFCRKAVEDIVADLEQAPYYTFGR